MYNEYVIFMNNIHAQLDEETGRMYVPGPLALEINRQVEGVIASIQTKDSGAQEQATQSLFKDIPLVVEMSAPDRHAA